MSGPAIQLPGAVITDELIDAIADRVAERMSRKTDNYDVPAAAKRLNVSEVTIRRRVKAGLLHPIPNLGRVVFTAKEIERFEAGESR